MNPQDTHPHAQEAQFEVWRRMGPQGRARIAFNLSESTRELTRCGIRSRHPDYDESQVEWALRRLIYADELFQKVWPDAPLLAP